MAKKRNFMDEILNNLQYFGKGVPGDVLHLILQIHFLPFPACVPHEAVLCALWGWPLWTPSACLSYSLTSCWVGSMEGTSRRTMDGRRVRSVNGLIYGFSSYRAVGWPGHLSSFEGRSSPSYSYSYRSLPLLVTTSFLCSPGTWCDDGSLITLLAPGCFTIAVGYCQLCLCLCKAVSLLSLFQLSSWSMPSASSWDPSSHSIWRIEALKVLQEHVLLLGWNLVISVCSYILIIGPQGSNIGNIYWVLLCAYSNIWEGDNPIPQISKCSFTSHWKMSFSYTWFIINIPQIWCLRGKTSLSYE